MMIMKQLLKDDCKITLFNAISGEYILQVYDMDNRVVHYWITDNDLNDEIERCDDEYVDVGDILQYFNDNISCTKLIPLSDIMFVTPDREYYTIHIPQEYRIVPEIPIRILK